MKIGCVTIIQSRKRKEAGSKQKPKEGKTFAQDHTVKEKQI